MLTYNFNQIERDRWVTKQAGCISNGSSVLDVGAGSGRYRSLFDHCDYKAQDFGQEPGTIGKYTKLDYECDITTIPAPDDSFDVVLCTEVLEHVPKPIKVIHELSRILKPGGKLILTAPLASFLHQEPFHFYGGYTPYWYRRFLPEAGLDVINIEANRGFFSLFGQESRRFGALIAPHRTFRSGWYWPLLTLLWLISFPFCYFLFPLLGSFLDRLEFEKSATVGYHVIAVKQTEN